VCACGEILHLHLGARWVVPIAMRGPRRRVLGREDPEYRRGCGLTLGALGVAVAGYLMSYPTNVAGIENFNEYGRSARSAAYSKTVSGEIPPTRVGIFPPPFFRLGVAEAG
jgi:hypothetical protein